MTTLIKQIKIHTELLFSWIYGTLSRQVNISGDLAKAIKDIRAGACHSINLSYRNIGPKGVRYLADALRGNSSITALNIAYNSVGDEGARYLAESLRSNFSLTVLHMYGNRVGDEGMRYIAEALRSNSSLTVLDMCNNHVGAEGMRYLAESLRSNSSLTTLEIGFNRVNDEGNRYITEALPYNSSLTSISLGFYHGKRFWPRKTCLLARNKIFLLLFCGDFVECSLLDRSVLMTTFKYLEEPSDLIPECW